MSSNRTLTAVLHKECNTYVAECLEVGTTSQGPTIEEAVKNLQKATEVYLEKFPGLQNTCSFLTTFEVTVDE